MKFKIDDIVSYWSNGAFIGKIVEIEQGSYPGGASYLMYKVVPLIRIRDNHIIKKGKSSSHYEGNLTEITPEWFDNRVKSREKEIEQIRENEKFLFS